MLSFDKVSGQKPPDPVRGFSGNNSNNEDPSTKEGSSSSNVVNVADLIPRNDIRYAKALPLYCIGTCLSSCRYLLNICLSKKWSDYW